MAHRGLPMMSETQLRVKLRDIRNRSPENTGGDDAIDSAIVTSLRRLRRQKPVCTRRRLCLWTVGIVALFVYLVLFVIPEYHEPTNGYVTRFFGKLSYPALRLFRKAVLPLTRTYPDLDYYYTSECTVKNPLYKEDSLEEDAEDFPLKKRSKKKRSSADPCPCTGVRSPGRIKNRDALKLKHIVQHPGKPLVLTLAESFKHLTLDTFLNISGDGLTESLCHFEPKRENENCATAIATALASLKEKSSKNNFAWSYCPYSRGVDRLLSWLKPSSYLVGSNVKISRHISLLLGRKGDPVETLPLPLPMEHEIHVVHQVFGSRTFYLEPVSCKKCHDIKVSLTAGQVVFFNGVVYGISLESPADDWALSLTYSVAAPGSTPEPYSEKGNCS